MKTTKGFNNLHTIKTAITHLYSILGSHRIEGFNEDFFISAENIRYNGDVLIATQRLAHDIACHYKLPITTVVVSYSSTMQQPGRVELGTGNEFFIEIQSKYRSKINVVAGILAHEISHIFLHRHGAEWKETDKNEILTDTAACLLGFGIAIFNAAHYDTDVFLNRNQTKWEYFGYLSLDEFGYVIARRDFDLNLNSLLNIRQQRCKDAYKKGLNKYKRELKSRPFSPRPWYHKFLSWSQIKSERSIQNPLHFECPKCSKTLRIPQLRKKISVHCPLCKSIFSCYS